MGRVSDYERLQIESILQPGADRLVEGVGLFLMPDDALFRRVYDIAVLPSLRACGMDRRTPVIAFDSASFPADVCRWIQSAEIIVAEMTQCTAHLLYALGLSHGLGRCPILIGQDADTLPFNLNALRYIDYRPTPVGLIDLRERLTRALRTFQSAAKGPRDASPPNDDPPKE